MPDDPAPANHDGSAAATPATGMPRRQLVATAIVAATAATTFGRGGSAAAASGDPVLIGRRNSATDQTIIENTAQFPISGNRGLFVTCENMAAGRGIEATGSHSGVSAIGRSENAQFPSGTAVGLEATTLDDNGYGAVVDAGNGLAPLLLAPMAIDGPPTAGTHRAGEMLFDRNGRLFVCTAGGFPGTWGELGGRAAAFTALATVERFVDTRTGLGITAGTLKAGSTLTLSITGRNGQSGDPALQIPDDAVAITGNLSVTGAPRVAIGSFVTLWPSGKQPPTPLVFFPPAGLGGPVTNSFVIGLAGLGVHRGVTVFNSAACDLSIDVTGFSTAP